MNSQLKDRGILRQCLLQLSPVVHPLGVLAHKKAVRVNCAIFTSTRVVEVVVVRAVAWLLMFLSTLTKCLSKLIATALCQDVDLGLIVVTVVRSGSLEATHIVAVRKQVGRSALIAIRS